MSPTASPENSTSSHRLDNASASAPRPDSSPRFALTPESALSSGTTSGYALVAPLFQPSHYTFRSVDADGALFLFNTASGRSLVLTPAQRALFECWSENPASFPVPESHAHRLGGNAVSPRADALADPHGPGPTFSHPVDHLSDEPFDSASSQELNQRRLAFIGETNGYAARTEALKQDSTDVPSALGTSETASNSNPADADTQVPTQPHRHWLVEQVSDTDLPARLLKDGFFVPASRSELKQILSRMKQERQQRAHISLTLSMTSDCDLACPYCVIRTTKGKGGMPLHVQQALLRWWEQQLVGRSTCSFEWMGGEPLLYPQTLLSLGKELLARAEVAGVTCIQQTLITNGTHLTPELLPALKAMGIRHIQITLDGPPELHDVCRPSLDGKGSFETILRHIQAASKDFAISIRVNLTQSNAERYSELLDRLAAEGLQSLAVYPARVYEPESRSECGSFSQCSLTPEDYARLAINFELDGMDRGFQRTALPRVAYGGFCGAYHQSYFVVGPDGLLYRCPSRVGQVTSSAVGSVFDVAPAPYMARNQAYYDALGPTETKGCFSCKLLPGCLGGCPEESKVSGELVDECSPWRFRLKHQLAIEHEWLKACAQEIPV